jgi:hypothetical protein
MTTTTATTAERLRSWAKGSLPCMTAVDFVLAVHPDLADDNPFVAHDDHPTNRITYLDVFGSAEEFEDKLGGLSSGERATWYLARSIVDGDLYDMFWSLDSGRQNALLDAMRAHLR